MGKFQTKVTPKQIAFVKARRRAGLSHRAIVEELRQAGTPLALSTVATIAPAKAKPPRAPRGSPPPASPPAAPSPPTGDEGLATIDSVLERLATMATRAFDA